jgi:hypothetical protein
MPHGMGVSSRDPLQIGKHPVAALTVQSVESAGKERVVIHCFRPIPVAVPSLQTISF